MAYFAPVLKRRQGLSTQIQIGVANEETPWEIK